MYFLHVLALILLFLGAAKPRDAQGVALLTIVLLVCFGIVNGGLGMLYRNVWGRLFSNDDNVVNLMSSMFPLLWLYGVIDVVKCFGMSLLRGTGRPQITLLGNTVALIAGFSMSLLLGLYVGMGLSGIWIGITFSWTIVGLLYCSIIAVTDWDAQVKLALMEVKSGQGSISASLIANDLEEASVEERKEVEFSNGVASYETDSNHKLREDIY
jgi:MATE family multidrug resistance protein